MMRLRVVILEGQSLPTRGISPTGTQAGIALRFEATVHRCRGLTFLVGLVAGLITDSLDGAAYGTMGFFVGQAARGLLAWCLIVVLFGLFFPLRQRNPPLLGHASEMVLPFYIVHQPVIVLTGYYLVLPTEFSPFAKYMLIIVMCLPAVVAIYELLVRRTSVLRVLLGLKPLARR